ncbi:hypothetical protein ACEWY4_010408 [Coilia grayii]|uniref:Cadherin prodomain domain-containing protein n=1 Tax=Coilia grayii TaxID=363190 RepID=A0ABD1K1T7_9TELE
MEVTVANRNPATIFTFLFFSVSVLSVLFDDCAGNEAVTFEVSNPDFLVDGDLRLVAQRDVLNSGQVLFIHGLSQHADDMAQVDVVGAPARSSHSLREVLGVDRAPSSRLRRSLLVPPMFVIENQRANFPRIIGKVGPLCHRARIPCHDT